jgi:hypothetical protein
MAVTAAFLTEIVAQAHIPSAVNAPPRKPGVFARFWRALEESRLRQVEAELARRAGLQTLLTDDVERKMGEAMFRSGRTLM